MMADLINDEMTTIISVYSAGAKNSKSVKSDQSAALGNSNMWATCMKLLNELQKQANLA